MERKILTVYTGGTICTEAGEEGRELAPELAKRALLANFSRSRSKYAKLCKTLFVDSDIPEEYQTLSENMTLEKLNRIIEHLRSFDMSKYAGVIIMHGTDTLAFSAAIFSILLADTPVPVMLVSGDRPPADKSSNANANFRAAVELIMSAIAPNVYVPYRNSDGEIYLHLGSRIMQCANYSDNFFSPNKKGAFPLSKRRERRKALKKCAQLSLTVKSPVEIDLGVYHPLKEGALLVYPYTGLDYGKIPIENAMGVIHRTYHSGTVCLERNKMEEKEYSSHSVLYFADRCRQAGVPLFISPCKLSDEQYSTIFDLNNSSGAVFLDMTAEMAYAKLTVGISYGLCGKELEAFMLTQINNENIG